MISIIIPVYNVEKYICGCIDSVLNQTFKDFELILVESDSPDNSGAICDAYAAKDTRITVLHKKNEGQSAARNAGIERATGEYITFIDSDDTVSPHFLQTLLSMFTDFPQIDISICGCQQVPESKTEFEDITPADHPCLLLNNQQLWEEVFGKLNNSACNKLYKKELIGNIRFPMGIFYGEDLLFNLEYLQHCTTGAISPLFLYFYYKRSGSVTDTKFNKKHLTELISKDSALEMVEAAAPEQINNAKKYCFKARIGMVRKIYKDNVQQQFAMELKECKEYIHHYYTEVKPRLNTKEKLEVFFIKLPKLYRLLLKLI